MKKLSMIMSILCISILFALPAFAQLAYQIDVGQDGTFETGGYISLPVSGTVTMDIYVSGYTCSTDQLFGTMSYILSDDSKVSVSGFPYDTANLGPWDSELSDFSQREPNVYYLATGNFNYVTVVGGRQKLGTMTLTGAANGCFTMRVANNLTSFGYGAYNDGYISDCILESKLPANAVLNVAVGTPGADLDADGVPACFDNCPTNSNPGQEDTLPPGGNSCGDACECEGNFDGDFDVDGTDASTFKGDFGRSKIVNPCTNGNPCNGDFSCNVNVDGTDASKFKSDFGRSQFNNRCPNIVTDPWCVYP
jgi:hypothetical protein